MLPGPILSPPPPPFELIGSPPLPSASPSDPNSSSISSSLAIIVVIIITTVTVTTCIVVLRRSCQRRRRLSSAFSPRRSFSPMAAVSSSLAESETRSAKPAVVGASPRDRAAMSLLEIAVVSDALKDSGAPSAAWSAAHSAEGPVNGEGLVASSPVSGVMAMCGVNMLVPSAPSLPEVERLILELLSLPAVPMKPGSRICNNCEEVIPTDVLVVLPVCSHMFHQSCIIDWLRSTTPSCCPSCHASITIPGPDKTEVTPTFCPDDFDIESQMLVPRPPGEGVSEAVGGSHGWLRSSLDRLSGSWRGCSSNRATAAVVPVSSWRTTGSWSQGSSGHLGNDSDCDEANSPLPVLGSEEMTEAVRGSIGWLRSLPTLSGRWSWRSSRGSAEMALPVTSRHVAETLASSGHSSSDSWSRWDLEAAAPLPERPSLSDYARWFFRSSDKLSYHPTA